MATSVTPGSRYSKNAKPYAKLVSVKSREEMVQYLGCTSSIFSNKVERPELAETLEELHDVFFVEVSRQTADKHFVNRIRNIGGDDARNMNTR